MNHTLYEKKSNMLQEEEKISFVKMTFLQHFKNLLNLTEVRTQLAVLDNTGVNDDLNGVETPVRFPVEDMKVTGVVVHSLAKWKRMKLGSYQVPMHHGIVTEMMAVRAFETLDDTHSIIVDQFDWEAVISKEDRNIQFLKYKVTQIYEAIKLTLKDINKKYPDINLTIPDTIKFVHTEELIKLYPNLSSNERENEIGKLHKAVFIIGVGNVLSNGKPHDGRAPDYDDWSSPNEDGYYGLNGDILLWHPALNRTVELSSMGIRVDKTALLKQLEIRKFNERKELDWHKLLLNDQIPLSIGGGIGISRLLLFLLQKKHMGQVQNGIWPKHMIEENKKSGLTFLN